MLSTLSRLNKLYIQLVGITSCTFYLLSFYCYGWWPRPIARFMLLECSAECRGVTLTNAIPL